MPETRLRGPRDRRRHRPAVRRAARAVRDSLLVFLRGGYDALNLLVPYSSGFYYESRPNDRDRATRCRPRTAARSRWMRTGRSRRPCAIPSARCTCSARSPSFRSPAPTICRAATSKPRTASSSANRLSGTRDYRSGFLGRLAGTLLGTLRRTPIAFTDALPLAFEGASDRAQSVAQECRQTALR